MTAVGSRQFSSALLQRPTRSGDRFPLRQFADVAAQLMGLVTLSYRWSAIFGWERSFVAPRSGMVSIRAGTRNLVAWSLWLITFGFCAAGLVVTLVVTRPLTAAVLAEGAAFALVFPLGYALSGWS